MAECLFIKADEVVKMLGVSQSEAYRIIKKLNEEMEDERAKAKKPSVLQKLKDAKADLPKKSPGKAKEAEL